MSVSENIKTLCSELPQGVKLVAVTKTRSPDEVMELYSAGHKVMGENRVQEMVVKKDILPEDVEWHMIGHLQSNKVKYIAPFISMIHSVDSEKLLKAVSREAEKNGRIIDCCLQVHIAREESKYGFSEDELLDFLQGFRHDHYPGARLRGLMGMATFTGNEAVVRSEFRGLAGLFDRISKLFFSSYGHFNELSMGMSGDYMIAIEEGSTIVRIGSLIFENRKQD